MKRRGRPIAALLMAATLFSAGWLLQNSGLYGLVLFIVSPAILGALGAWAAPAKSAMQAAKIGALIAFLASGFLLLLGLEGLICIAMAVPLTIPMGALGGWIAYTCEHHGRTASSTAMLLLLPVSAGSLGWDAIAKPPVYEVRTSIEIAAPPERIWPNVVSFGEIPEPREWFFRTGIAYPTQTRIGGEGPGAARYCDVSTGTLVERVEIWDEPRLLQFQVTDNPAPMKEWSPYGNISPRHLHGYFISKRGQFRLIPLANGHTLVQGTSWYQHGLWPAPYWRLWSDAIIHRIHIRVLTHIRHLSEAS